MKRFTIAGPIDEELLRRFYKFVDNLGGEKDVRVCITSGGGDAGVALAIAGIMDASKATGAIWTTQAFGYVYSAATLVFSAGNRRIASKAGFFMVHEGAEKIKGDASTIKRHAKHMERYEDHWNTIMEAYTGTPKAQWAKISEKDTYINAEEAINLGMATETI